MEMSMAASELDHLLRAYKEAVDRWVVAIREEEALATPDHSIAAWEHWDQAGFKAHEAQNRAIAAKEAYKDGLRRFDYGV
jgi:hypothetical protein